MNRKQVLGRASLSFPAEEGLLDIDQILETESWNQIDDFVQQNFLQNILNEFNNRMTIDPKHTPTDSKSLGKKRPTTSSRTARKCQTGRTTKEKPTEGNNDPRASDATNPKERKKEIANKSESSTKKQTKKERIRKNKENKENPIIEGAEGKQKDKGESNGETYKAKKLPVNRQKRNASTLPVKKQEIATPLNNSTEKVVNASLQKTKEIVTKKMEIKSEPKVEEDSMPRVNKTENVNSTSPFQTSTPKHEKSQFSNSLGKEAVIARYNLVALKRSASIKKHCEEDLNNNCPETTAAKEENTKVAEKCEHKAVTSGKMKNVKEPKSNVTSEGAKTGKGTRLLKCAKGGSGKMATTETKKIGNFEQRLLERQDRRGKKKIRRHERKAERAMEKFSHHVMRIAKQMGYLPDDSSGDDSDNYCCCNSSAESSYSDSCCTNSSCSCCTSCSSYSSQYSEYTLGSSSD